MKTPHEDFTAATWMSESNITRREFIIASAAVGATLLVPEALLAALDG
jgi:hypothetical protein